MKPKVLRGLGTEVVSMGTRSVPTAVGGRYDHSQHLSLASAQGRISVHQGAVETHRGPEDSRILAHDADDIPDSARAVECCLILSAQQTRGLINGDDFDPGHASLTRIAAALAGFSRSGLPATDRERPGAGTLGRYPGRPDWHPGSHRSIRQWHKWQTRDWSRPEYATGLKSGWE